MPNLLSTSKSRKLELYLRLRTNQSLISVIEKVCFISIIEIDINFPTHKERMRDSGHGLRIKLCRLLSHTPQSYRSRYGVLQIDLESPQSRNFDFEKVQIETSNFIVYYAKKKLQLEKFIPFMMYKEIQDLRFFSLPSSSPCRIKCYHNTLSRQISNNSANPSFLS